MRVAVGCSNCRSLEPRSPSTLSRLFSSSPKGHRKQSPRQSSPPRHRESARCLVAGTLGRRTRRRPLELHRVIESAKRRASTNRRSLMVREVRVDNIPESAPIFQDLPPCSFFGRIREEALKPPLGCPKMRSKAQPELPKESRPGAIGWAWLNEVYMCSSATPPRVGAQVGTQASTSSSARDQRSPILTEDRESAVV